MKQELKKLDSFSCPDDAKEYGGLIHYLEDVLVFITVISRVNPIKEFTDLIDIKISSYKECRSLCCNLNERCTTWQYQNSTSTCFIQARPVRLGMEGSDTVLWCDQFPPHAWHGYRLQSRLNGACKWGEALPNQCFAFGAERMNPVDKSRVNETLCAEMCCKDPTCDSWQEMP
eukprot:gene7794-10533_t